MSQNKQKSEWYVSIWSPLTPSKSLSPGSTYPSIIPLRPMTKREVKSNAMKRKVVCETPAQTCLQHVPIPSSRNFPSLSYVHEPSTYVYLLFDALPLVAWDWGVVYW